MFPAVGAVRKRGTSVIFEDIAVPTDVLAPAALDLQALFRKHRYEDGIIFGHAKDGNLHFVISQSFNDDAGDPAVRGVQPRPRRDGGRRSTTARSRPSTAPAATWRRSSRPSGAARRSRSWCASRSLVDPDGLLNPGVLVNHDPAAHLKDLKSLPEVEEEVDKCIECGFCESLCPSRDLTLTPAAADRRAARDGAARAPTSPRCARRIEYDALDTCATDGLCALACPVSIDTGTADQAAAGVDGTRRQRGALAATCGARTFDARSGWCGPRCAPRELAGPLRRLAAGRVPRSRSPLPGPAGALPAHRRGRRGGHPLPVLREPDDGCATRARRPEPIGARGDDRRRRTRRHAAAHSATHRPTVLRHAIQLEGISRGAGDCRQRHDRGALWTASHEGALPVVVDTSPCAYAMTQRRRSDRGQPGTARANAARRCRRLLPHDRRSRRSRCADRAGTVVLHPVCSLVKMGNAPHSPPWPPRAATASSSRRRPGCCGFAGDRGFFVPELTEAATRMPAAEVRAVTADGHYSSSRTCEIGMSRATGRHYRSWIQLLDWATGE